MGTIMIENDLKKYKRHVKSLNMSIMGQDAASQSDQGAGKTEGLKDLIGAPLDESKVITSLD